MNALLIGIDCATQDSKVGLALAAYRDGSVVLEQATLCSRKQSAAGLVAEWAENATLPVLFAVDAPLGWPASMGSILNRHRAGQPLEVPANEFFRRTTDRFVYSLLGKTPLDVGADRIARTAHAALALLSDVSRRLNRPISLAWSPEVHGVAAIEVYPAATLAARGVRSTGYKKPEHAAERREIADAVDHHTSVGEHRTTLESHPDALDAVVCLLAAKEFLEDRCLCPANRELAEREGWIWTSARLAK